MPAANAANVANNSEQIRAQIAELEQKLRDAEAAEIAEAQAENAKVATAILAAMKEAYRRIQEMFPDTFSDEKYAALATSQAWPRDTKFRRVGDLSETEVENAREAGRKAIAALK